jgi:two-component system cell cycle sensor histidine kinase/response regulator CckA
MSIVQSLSEFVFGPVPTAAAAHPFPLEPDRRTIMVVDDDTALLESVQYLLHEAGFNVLKSDRGVKGLEVFDFIPSDVRVILLDYQMPELDGERTLQLLRKINPHVKIVAFTGVAMEELPSGYRNGVDKIVTKPFDSAELIEMLNEFCAAAV